MGGGGGVQARAVGVEVGRIVARTGVDVGRGGGQVVREGVGEAAGRGDVAVEDLGDRPGARGTRRGDDQAGVEAGDGLHEAELHHVGGVDEDDHVLIRRADVFEQGLFLGRDLEIGARLVDVLRARLALARAVLVLHLPASRCSRPKLCR